jgi:hypothetical protein
MRGKNLVLLKSQKGILTVDYLFALTLVMGFTTILFALSMTLVVSEIVQYMTFASARAFIAGHVDPDKQKELGSRKYSELWSHNSFNSFFSNGWFVVPSSSKPGNYNRAYPVQGSPKLHYFTGVQTQFTSKILDLRIPFFGSTSDQTSGGKEKGFTSVISSFLIREPSSSECHTNFISERWKNIKSISPYGAYTTTDPAPIADNGC